MPKMKFNDVEVYYEAFGDPEHETLLLVNGLGTQAIAHEVEFCEAFVERGFHVIRFDNRDVGLSTHMSGDVPDVFSAYAVAAAGGAVDAPYTLTEMAADGMALVDGLGIERAHIFGSSMGGMIVQQMAINHPDKVLSATSVRSTTGEPEYGMPDPDALSGLVSIMVPAETREARIETGVSLQKLIGSPSQWDESRVRARATEQVDRSYDPSGTARQLLAILASGSRAEGLRNLAVPMMVLHGDADPLVNISGGRRTAELVPGAELRVMEGMGHDLPPAYWDWAIDAVTTVTKKGATSVATKGN